jgi:hypothetical protein
MALLVVAAILAARGAAAAQTPPPQPPRTPTQTAKPPAPPRKPAGPPKWTFEIHGGTLAGGSTSGSPVGDLPAGTPFSTVNGLPSQQVTSWYYGAGSTLFNQVAAAFGSQFGPFNVTIPRITPIDDVVRRSGLARSSAVAIGIRVQRVLTPKIKAEFTFDRAKRSAAVAGDVQAALESSRASFDAAFRALLATIPQTGGQVTTALTTPEVTGSRVVVTGSLVLSLVKRGKLEAYAVAGAGGVVNSGSALDVQLRGGYNFSIGSQYPINESETIVIHYTEQEQSGAGVVGGGVTFDVNPKGGLRVDVRAVISKNGLVTTLDSATGGVRGSPFTAFPSITTPAIQFSTTTGTPTSLGGAAVNGLETFKGTGMSTRIQFSVGYFFRF